MHHDTTEVGEGEFKNIEKALKQKIFNLLSDCSDGPEESCNTLYILKQAMMPSKIMSYFHTSQGIL
jgi:hypothetical protein